MLLMPLPPLFLFMIYLIYSYRHSTSSKKSKERAELEKAEYLWNTVDTVEAGFEASGEILLQVWLLGPQILHITNMGMKEFIDGIFFLEDATDTEKSLGKVIHHCSLVNSVQCGGMLQGTEEGGSQHVF